MSNTNDRTLAYIIYGHFGIPHQEWPQHFALDTWHGALTDGARQAYTKIWHSLTHPH